MGPCFRRDDEALCFVIPGRASARTRNLAPITSGFRVCAQSAHPGMTAVGAKRLASPSPEIRDPALFGGFDAFLEIFGCPEPRLFGGLVIGRAHPAVRPTPPPSRPGPH